MGVKIEKTNATLIGELLDASKALPRRLNDVDTLRFSLEELKQRAQTLKTQKGEMVKAHYLLMNSGINVEDVMSQLDKLSTQSNYVQKNVNLRGLKVMDKMDDIYNVDQSLDKSYDDFEKYVNSNIHLDWKVRKRELKDKLNGILKRDASNTLVKEDTKRPTSKELLQRQLTWGAKNNKSLISSNFKFIDINPSIEGGLSNTNPQISIALRKKFESYAQVIYSLNDSRQKGEEFPLATAIYDLNKTESHQSDQFTESLQIIRSIFEAGDKFDGNLKESYQNYDLNDFNTIKLRKFYVKQSRKFLEQQFSDFVNDLYAKSLNGEGQLRSRKPIDVFDKLINFINVTLKDTNNKYKVPHMTFVNGVPIWAVVFYCIRGGFHSEALQFLQRYEDSFNKIEKWFPVYLKDYINNEGSLKSHNWGKINNEYNQYFKLNNDIDPFKVATYKILGRLDLAKKSVQDLPLSIEDWVWLHLSLINEEDLQGGGIISERYSLNDFQRTILEFGKDAFNSSNNNPLYLQILILVGLNEEAVKYYMNIEEMDAIHLSILLNYYGILRTNELSNYKLLNYNDEGFAELDFAQLIGYYVKNFKFSDPVVSAEYLFLIGINNTNLALKEIKQLVLESREFVLLLGKVNSQGFRQAGIIERRRSLLGLEDLKIYLHEISEGAARRAEEEGQILDAISLYQLSEEYDIVLKLLNRLLCDNGEEYIKLGKNLSLMYKSSVEIMSKIDDRNLTNLNKILEFYEIENESKSELVKNGYEDKVKIDRLLERVQKMNILPIDENIDISDIRRLASELNGYDECILKILPKVLILTLELLRIKHDKNITRNLLIFGGLIKYKMPREVYSKMVQMGVLI